MTGRLVPQLARDRRGATAVVIGLSMTAMLGAAGLAIDLGLWYTERRAAQDAADSAAYSAAIDYAAGDSSANVTAAAKAVAAQYGLTDGSNGVTVSVNTPPTLGSNISTSGAVEVIIRKAESQFFSGLFLNSASIGARAVAVSGYSGGKYCLLVLDAAAATTVSTAGVSATNGVVIDMSTCGLYVNASGSDALYVSGGAIVRATNVSLVGNYSVSGGATLTVTGTLATSAAAMTDPYASVTVPTPGACAATNSWAGSTVATINPGTYCNGFTVSNGAKITMNPGVYIVDRGVFKITGAGVLTGTSGVTIVLTSSSGTNYATATVDNGATVNITAPSSGATKGLAIMQDRRASAAGSNSFGGGSATTVRGALYFPAQMVNFTNGTNATVCLQLIAYRVTFTGGATFSDNCSGFGTTEIGSSGGPSLVE